MIEPPLRMPRSAELPRDYQARFTTADRSIERAPPVWLGIVRLRTVQLHDLLKRRPKPFVLEPTPGEVDYARRHRTA